MVLTSEVLGFRPAQGCVRSLPVRGSFCISAGANWARTTAHLKLEFSVDSECALRPPASGVRGPRAGLIGKLLAGTQHRSRRRPAARPLQGLKWGRADSIWVNTPSCAQEAAALTETLPTGSRSPASAEARMGPWGAVRIPDAQPGSPR